MTEDKTASPVQSESTPAAQTAQPTPVEPAEGQSAQTAEQPVPTQQPAQTAQQPSAQPAPAQTAQQPANQPAATADQVAQVVTREFPGYDKDKNGALDQAEFAAWMNALRKASDPAFQEGTPAAATWAQQAFAQADSDKSASVNQGELTTFLTPKPKAS